MGKKSLNTIGQRISIEMNNYLKNFAEKNKLSIPDASREIIKLCGDIERKGIKKIIKELNF